MTQVAARIATLDDANAVRVLALVLQRQGLVVDATTARLAEERLQEALEQPEMAEFQSAAEDPPSEGELARISLCYLAQEKQLGADIEQAMSLASEGERFEPVTVAVGALVLFAFHSEFELRKDPERGWSFHFHAKPLKDSTVGSLLGKLFGFGR